MTTPSSGSISLNDVQTEFGGTAPTNITEYYLGAGYVTSNNTTVPSSGTISLNQFYGTTKLTAAAFTLYAGSSYSGAFQGFISPAFAAATYPDAACGGMSSYAYKGYSLAGVFSVGSAGQTQIWIYAAPGSIITTLTINGTPHPVSYIDSGYGGYVGWHFSGVYLYNGGTYAITIS